MSEADAYDAPLTSYAKVWHIPQIPGRAFTVECGSVVDAFRIADILASYDLFQYEHNVKPDYANMNGVLVWSDDDGCYEDYDPADAAATAASADSGPTP